MSIIAEALKKAQEKRTQATESIDSRLEKILSGEETLIPESLKKNYSVPTSPIVDENKKNLPVIKKPFEILFLASAIFLVSAAIFLPSYFLNTPGSKRAGKNLSASENLSTPLSETPIKNAPEVVFSKNTAKNDVTGTFSQEKEYYPSPLSTNKTIPVLPSLSGIMYSSLHPQAIINGSVMSEGETADNIHVVKILPGSVIVLLQGETHEIKLR